MLRYRFENTHSRTVCDNEAPSAARRSLSGTLRVIGNDRYRTPHGSPFARTSRAAYLAGVTASPSEFGLAPTLASEVDNVAASLGISPGELIDRAVRRELARQLLDGVFDQADGMDPDEATRLVYAERDASRSQS